MKSSTEIRVLSLFSECHMLGQEIVDDIFAARPGRPNTTIVAKSALTDQTVMFHRGRLEAVRDQVRSVIREVVPADFFDEAKGGQSIDHLVLNRSGRLWCDPAAADALFMLANALGECKVTGGTASKPNLLFMDGEPKC